MPLVTRVCGKAVGVVGMGRVGATVARRLTGFDADIAYSMRTVATTCPMPSSAI